MRLISKTGMFHVGALVGTNVMVTLARIGDELWKSQFTSIGISAREHFRLLWFVSIAVLVCTVSGIDFLAPRAKRFLDARFKPSAAFFFWMGFFYPALAVLVVKLATLPSVSSYVVATAVLLLLFVMAVLGPALFVRLLARQVERAQRDQKQ
jgi:hypothetical protein